MKNGFGGKRVLRYLTCIVKTVFFVSDQLRLEYDNKHQEQYFSGFGAQHHNTISERAIKTIIYTEITFMVQYSLHCKYHGADDKSNWYFSVKHAVWLHNRFPNYCPSITPI